VEALRIKHRMQVLIGLRDGGPLSRVELARRTSLSNTTLTKVVADLIDRGWIVEAQTRRTRELGRPQVELALVAHACRILVVVIDPDAVALGVVGLDLEPLHLERHACRTSDSRDTLDRVASLVKRFRRFHSADATNVRGLAVVLPGGTDTRLRMVSSSRQLGWHGVPVSDSLEASCSLPVIVHNNTRAMGFAEFRALGLHEEQPMLFLQARFGLGAAMVNSMSPNVHAHYGVSELAYIPVAVNRFRHKAPTPDKHLVRVLTQKYLETVLDVSAQDGPVVALMEARRRAGDSAARRLYNQTIENLACGLGVAVDILHPRIIVLGGVFAHASAAFIDDLNLRLRERAQPEHTESLVIQCSCLGPIGAVQGGAIAAFDRCLADAAIYEQRVDPPPD
jgi:predicted NBD/HSP70 family sugar kinase